MSCNCINTFSFNIHFNDCKSIIYIDNSLWVEVPETYVINILVPGTTIWKEFIVNTNVPTTITAVQLIGFDQNLPSGIYCVKVTNCNGDIFQYDFLNLCTYECQLANLISMMDFSCKNNVVEEQLEQYMTIKLWLEAAKAKFDCDWCNKEEVKVLLSMLNKKLNNVKNCKCS